MTEPTVQAVEVDGTWRLVCRYFAACGKPTLTATDHPVLGPIPICLGCAAKIDLDAADLIDVEVTLG
jgi:hypothetical protein